MKIALTFDLRSEYLAEGYSEEETAEFDSPATIDALQAAIDELGHSVIRVGHARRLMERLVSGERWDLVFNICEGLHGTARESQVPAILDVYGLNYTFSDPLVTGLCLHKGHTKLAVAAAGIPTSQYAVVESLADLGQVQLPYPLFTKPISEGTGKGIDAASIVRSPAELPARVKALLAAYKQPVLVEEYLPGREFTVGLLGTGDQARVLGTLEIILKDKAEQGVYSYTNKELCEQLVEYPLVLPSDPAVQAAEDIALSAWRVLGCRDGGRVDLRCDARGNPQFLEVNPLAGLHPTHSDLPMLATAVGLPYAALIGEIIRSAARRSPAK